jgi:hypothetical protein
MTCGRAPELDNNPSGPARQLHRKQEFRLNVGDAALRISVVQRNPTPTYGWFLAVNLPPMRG